MTSSQVFALLGHPVGHSVSPAIHQAVYDQFGLPHHYVVVDCPDIRALEVQVENLRKGERAGLNVTVPWKREALQLSDDVDESARATGAANVLVRRGSKVVAFNTDAPALATLLEDGISSPAPSSPVATAIGERSAVVLGNGGAALAAAVACKQAGAGKVFVSARKWIPQNKDWPKAAEFRDLGAELLPWVGAADEGALTKACASASWLVQASSAGMLGVGNGEAVAEVVPWNRLSRDCFAYDVVYNPPTTPFLSAAYAAGVHAAGGLTMLVEQAAQAAELWLDLRPDRTRMFQAAQRALFGNQFEEVSR